MRRLATLLVLALCGGAFAFLAGGASESDPGNEYTVEFDNAFGLIEGGDLKIAGVRAGKITKLALDRRTLHAKVSFKVTRDGFGSLRTDASCDTRPQSLIGEYFVDCSPGTNPQRLGDHGVIPVSRTTTTVGPDLVNTILRRPYKERLSIIINELGAAVAGNEDNLNDAIRRASPALRETDKVLAKLAAQNQTLAQLTTNADTVVTALDGNRADIGRWIEEARDIARDSAVRKVQIAQGFQRLPGFLDQLRPTMKTLGETADAQLPALKDLRASSGQLTAFLDRLGPFADASRPAFDGLSTASDAGDTAVKAVKPVVTQLQTTTKDAPEALQNLAIVLEHLDDPKNALENSSRAVTQSGRAAPTGYSGLEALLQYAFDQSVSTNIYDQNNHLLKVGVLAGGNCSNYADVAAAKKFGDECAASLGPNGPGLNSPDTTNPGTAPVLRTGVKPIDPARGPGLPAAPPAKVAPSVEAPAPDTSTPGATQTAPPKKVGPVEVPTLPQIPTVSVPTPATPTVPSITVPGVGSLGGAGLKGKRPSVPSRATQDRLLDFLLGP